MANTILTPATAPGIIAKEALFQLENNVVAGQLVHRQYKKEFVKIGDQVTIRKPVKFVAIAGATRSNQDVIEQTTSIVINNRQHVSWKFSSQDLTLTIEEYSERYIKPAMIVLANTVDRAICNAGALGFFNSTGTPGTTPATFLSLSNVGQKMDEEPVPDDGMRKILFNPAARWAMANGLGGTGSGGIFNADIVHNMVRRGQLGMIANFDIYGDQNVVAFTTADHAGTTLAEYTAPQVNGSTTFVLDGLTNATAVITAGTVFTVGTVGTASAVYSVNDVSKQSTGVLQQFVVTADSAAAVAGKVTVSVYPAFNNGLTASTAAYQTVSQLAPNNAPVAFMGTGLVPYPQNLAFHENAIALVTVPLELPDSASFKARADWRGYSIRVIKDYDVLNDEEIIRLDILFGVKVIYPELGVRIWG